MDVSDPQTLGFVVFGGFMFISAVGIALVSSLSMKETSYEEALAQQRRRLVQAPVQRAEKRKKNRTKRKEDLPDEKLPELPELPVSTGPEPEPVAESAAATPEPEPEPAPEPELEPEPELTAKPPAPSSKDKKKKSAKVDPAAVAKEVLVLAVTPMVDIPPVDVVPEEPKETTSKKMKSKTKPEPVTELLSTLSKMQLNKDETQKLMEVLNLKAGACHDSWQLACQKGDQLSTLRKQLEDKEKLLASQQEEAFATKTRLRELSQELGAEKSKMVSLDVRLKAELSAQVQKVNAMRTRMETQKQDHLKVTQQLNQKIRTLQDQLENGPNAQLTRLQQENSILRDALNQATSQTESRQNAELARLRQDCVHLGRELSERTDALRVDEERRKNLEAKMAAVEKELSQVQLVHEDTERALQQRLEEVMNRSQQEAAAIRELQGALESRETELQEVRVQLEAQVRMSEVDQLEHQLKTDGAEQQKDESGSEAESEQPFESLEKDSQLLRLEEELQQLREELQEARNYGNDKIEAELKTAQLQSRLSEAERKQTDLSTELDQNKKLLKETEAELQALQRRSDEEVNTWKLKLCEAEDQKHKLKDQLMLLEAQLEEQLEESSFSQSCCEELVQTQLKVIELQQQEVQEEEVNVQEEEEMNAQGEEEEEEEVKFQEEDEAEEVKAQGGEEEEELKVQGEEEEEEVKVQGEEEKEEMKVQEETSV